MRLVQEKKINEEYHKVQMLTTVAMPTPYISASLSHTAYINNVVSLVRLLTEGAALCESGFPPGGLAQHCGAPHT